MKTSDRLNAKCALTLFWLFASLVFGSADGDKIERVLQKTAADKGLTPVSSWTGTPEDQFFSVAVYDANVSGLQFQAVSYASADIKQALMKIGEAFGEAAKAQYGETPSGVSSSWEYMGIQVKSTSYAARDYKSAVMNTSMPSTTTVTVEANPLLTFAVTVQGNRDPKPYMKALIGNLKEAGLLGPVEAGVAFTLKVRKEGWIPLDRPIATGDISPSSITVTGQVVDPAGNPVPGATLKIPSLELERESDMAGRFKLYSPTEGKEPFAIDLTLHLQQPTSGTTVTITGPAQPVLPVPGTPKLKLTAVDKDGKPIQHAKVELNWTVPGFVKTPYTSAMLDKKGMLEIPLDIRKPEGLAGLAIDGSSLTVQLEAVIKPRDGGTPGKATFTAPLNLAIIVGQTTGPDMKPREEREAPWAVLSDLRTMCLDNWKDDTGRFRLLVHPLHLIRLVPLKGWALRWSDSNRLAVNCLIKPAPTPGKVLDVGPVDVLTVDEHVKRLTDVLKEFCTAMPLTPVEQSTAQKAIARLVFRPGYARSAPFYTDNYTDDSGYIGIPGKAAYYWGTNLMENNDSAYQIIPHEFGHFMHHHIIEKYAFRHVFYNSLSTGDHTTWAVPPGSSYKAPYLSFSENSADFFAMLFRNFWLDRYPEIADSPYFKLTGYLHEFENDEKAMTLVAAGTVGYKVEGIQTRFLRVFYGNAVNTRPAVVYNDYLNTMLLHVDRKTGWAGSLVNRPARTMYQWVQTKQRVPSGLGQPDVTTLATRYRMLPGVAPAPTIAPAFRDVSARIVMDGKSEDFRSFPVVVAPLGKTIQVTGGTISVDVSDTTNTRTLTVRAPARFKLISPTKVDVLNGLIGADFPVELVTPGGTVKPTGTVVQVNVDEQGNTRVDTLDGTVEITSIDGTVQTLNVGESLELASGGAMSAISACNPGELVAELLPDVDLPPVPKGRSDVAVDLKGLGEKLKALPWWAVLAAGLLVFLLAATILWLVRRLLAALITAPIIAVGIVAAARLILANDALKHLSFTELLLSPWTAWQTGHEWVPAAAWLIGGIVGGMIVGGGVRGLFTGILIPILPWILFHHLNALPPAWNMGAILDFCRGVVSESPADLLTLLGVCTLGCVTGGLLLPRRKRIPAPHLRQRTLRQDRLNRNNDGDWYDHHNHDDDGDDGDD